MTDTPKEIEAEVEVNRANVESTLDALRRKASLEGVVADVSRYVGITDARGSLETAGRQVAANPVAFGLIGLGLACFATGLTRRDPTVQYSQRPYDTMNRNAVSGTTSYSTTSHATAKSGPGIGEQARAYAGQAQDTAKHYGEVASDAAHSFGASVQDTAQNVGTAVQDGWDTARHRASDLGHQMQAQPLLFGAIALFAGAVIGSTLPKSNAENRWLGPTHDRLAESARDVASDLADRSTTALKAGLSAASDTAKDEGLLPDGNSDTTLAEKVQHIAEAAVDGASSEFRSTDKKA